MTNLATTPPTDYASAGSGSISTATEGPPEAMSNEQWVALARWCHSDGTQWMEQALRNQWEKNIKLFKNQHPSGSKYLSADYKGRSRLFRPKVRSSVLKSEAAAAAAFFTTDDVVALRPMNDNDQEQQASAEIWTEVINYRLKVTVPWFRLLIGAKQDAEVMGVCISRQEWAYQRRPDGTTAKDTPQITLIPAENCRCSPGSDWVDPVNSSPYWIEMRPMFVGDVKQMMKSPGHDGLPTWLPVEDAVLAKARNGTLDTTRMAREGRSGDPKDQPATLREHDIVWIHHNYIKLEGVDWYYVTGADLFLLSKPVPAAQMHRLGDQRPYVMGLGIIEAHRTHPAARVELLQDLQAEANEIANQRIDNVKLAMNGRYFAKAGKGIDVGSLTRSVPGAVTTMTDPTTDVVWHRPTDVTASSYAEQDRINVDFDELAGSFSPSSVQSNRKLNETVGGMNLLANSANGMAEYGLRIFANTWVEPVLRQLVKLEQAYETDVVLLAIAAQKRNLIQRFGISQITDELLAHSLTAEVNVGLAATNPDARLQKFVAAATAVGQLVGPMVISRVKPDEVIKEIFGHAGYKDGSRFFMPVPEGQNGMPGQGQPPPDPAQQKIAQDEAVSQKRIEIMDNESKAKIKREDAVALHQIQRERVGAKASQDLEMIKAFGEADAKGHPVKRPAAEAPSSMARLKAFLEQADQIGAAVEQIAQQGEQMQRAILALAEGQQRLMRGEQQIMQALGNAGQRLDRMHRQHGAGVERLAQHMAAPVDLIKDPDGKAIGTRKRLPDGSVQQRPVIYGPDGQPAGLGAPA